MILLKGPKITGAKRLNAEIPKRKTANEIFSENRCGIKKIIKSTAGGYFVFLSPVFIADADKKENITPLNK